MNSSHSRHQHPNARVSYLGQDITHRVFRPRHARTSRDTVGRYASPGILARFKARVRRAYRTFIAWTLYILRLAAILLAVLALMAVAAAYVHFEDTRPVSASFERSFSLASLALPTQFPVILSKICKAESHSSQTCTAALVKVGMCYSYEIGSPLISPNPNDTYDIGYCQINSIHLADARARGYDVINKEDDNKAYAMFLFNTQGTEPWNASKTNWK